MERVGDVMTEDPITLDAGAAIREAARIMREREVGDVLVTKDGELHGIVTDRDIVVRALANGQGPDCLLGDICTSDEVVTAGPDEALDAARDRMRKRAVRRIPVLEDGRPVGILSLGDLAIERAPRSLLGRISAAPSNC